MTKIYKKIFLSFFFKADFKGVLTISYGSELYKFGHDIAEGENVIREADIKVLDDRFFKLLIWYGDIGLGEAYFLNYFESSDLKKLLKWFLQNKKTLPGFNEKGKEYLFEWAKVISWVMHKLNKNTRFGSKKNIHKHYDVSNDFYQLWLDNTMTYSCAVFADGDDLYQAQIRKYENICRKINLSDADHVLEIGSGWGSFAIYAVQNYNCRITTTTISKEQYRLAKQKIEEAGLSENIELILRDYRDLEGEYDKIVSIEMMEALGHEYVPLFVEKCNSLLKKGGKMCWQCITIPDEIFQPYLRNNNYIKKYIFPGGELISLGHLKNAISKHQNLHIDDIENIGLNYAKTLNAWGKNLKTKKPEIMNLGFDEIFFKKWLYYFVYCEVAFATGYLDDAQVLIFKK